MSSSHVYLVFSLREIPFVRYNVSLYHYGHCRYACTVIPHSNRLTVSLYSEISKLESFGDSIVQLRPLCPHRLEQRSRRYVPFHSSLDFPVLLGTDEVVLT